MIAQPSWWVRSILVTLRMVVQSQKRLSLASSLEAEQKLDVMWTPAVLFPINYCNLLNSGPVIYVKSWATGPPPPRFRETLPGGLVLR